MKRATVILGAVAAIAAASLFGGGSVHAQSAPEATQATPPPAAGQVATVLPGDTLDKIAQDHGTNYQRLFNANPTIADPNVIYVDEVIRIPAANEQLADRPLPGSAATVPANLPSAPTPSSQAAVAPPAVAAGDVWDRLAQCESGGNWSIDTGNGYYGGLQFNQGTWEANGGSGSPASASREQQIAVGQTVVAQQGFSAWPACSSQLGL